MQTDMQTYQGKRQATNHIAHHMARIVMMLVITAFAFGVTPAAMQVLMPAAGDDSAKAGTAIAGSALAGAIDAESANAAPALAETSNAAPTFTASAFAEPAFAAVKAPAKVTGLKIKVNAQPTATLQWTAVKRTDGYVVYRNGKKLAKVKKSATAYVDRTLKPGATYSYTVKAYKKSGKKTAFSKASAAKKIEKGYTWGKAKDGKAKVTGYTGHTPKLTIPAKHAGKKVTEIGTAAFQGNLWITNLTIPEGVKTIDNYAFEACSGAKKIYFPDSLKTIGDCAFSGCAQMRLADLGDNVTSIGKGAFLYCMDLAYIDLPKNLKSLGKFAFAGSGIGSVRFIKGTKLTALPDRVFCNCTNLSSVAMKDTGIHTIGLRAFSGCKKLQEVDFPAGALEVRDYAFEKCGQLEADFSGSTPSFGLCVFALSQGAWETPASAQLYVSENSTFVQGTFGLSRYDAIQLVADQQPEGITGETGGEGTTASGYKLVDGSLLTADGETLLAYFPKVYDEDKYEFVLTDDAKAGTYHVPEGVKTIGAYAFAGCTLENGVVLSDTVEKVEAYAFRGSKVTRDKVTGGADNLDFNENAFDPKEANDDDTENTGDGSGTDTSGTDVNTGDAENNGTSGSSDGTDGSGTSGNTDSNTDDTNTGDDTGSDADEDEEAEITITRQSLAGEKSIFNEADFKGYLDVDKGFDAWVEAYKKYNKDIHPDDGSYHPYLKLYTGEDHYRQMTSALNHDAYKVKISQEMSGEDYEEMYLAMDHGLMAELNRGKMPQNLVLYSGITPERVSDLAGASREEDLTPADKQKDLIDKLVANIGNETRDEAFQSTTASLGTAFGFGSRSKVMVQIYASQKALDDLGTVCVDPFSTFSGEKEVLFNAGARYQILDVGMVTVKEAGTEENCRYVTLKLLGGSEN